MLFQKKNLIGVDIGFSTIKLAQVEVSNRAAKLLAFSIVPTPQTGEDSYPPTETISQAVVQAIDELRTKIKKAATAVWGNAVIVKKVTFSEMDPQMVAEQIEWEAERYIPYDLAEVSLTYKILSTRSAPGTMDVLLVAAVRDDVFRCAEVVELSGLSCAVMDVPGFALANCFEKTYGTPTNQNVALLNIGATVTQFVVVNAGDVLFCRDIPVGGEIYTREIIKNLSVSRDEAEMLKANAHAGEAAAEVDQILESTNRAVASEISESVGFFQSTHEGAQLDMCFVTGGGSLTKGLIQEINQNIACQELDPLQGLTVVKKMAGDYANSIRPFSSIALGLAMRKEGDND